MVVVVIVAVLAGSAGAESASDAGATLFREHCAGCHGEAGRTDTGVARALKVRPLVGDARFAGMAPAEIVHAIVSNAKHQCIGAGRGLDPEELEAVAVFVQHLARER